MLTSALHQDIAEIYKGKHLFAPIGNVNSVNLINNTVSLTSSSGTWGPSNNNHYAIGPTKGLSFGTNGFYLPFDPAETGANYSAITTVSNVGGNFVNDKSQMFDGQLNTNVNQEDGTATITFDPPIPLNGEKVYFYTSYGDSGSIKSYQINANNSVNRPGKFQWSEIPVGTDTEMSTITLVSDSFEGVDIYAIRVGDTELVDHNSIGVDASGNGNDFHDENFAVGNTDEVWSNYLVTSDDFMTNRGPDKGFDGNPSTICHGGVANATLTFDPGVTITGTEITFTTAYATEISFKDSTQNIAIPGADGVNGAASVTITIPGGEFTGFSVVNNEPTKGTSFNTVSVDGQLLIDKNIQDTVKDTPMRNYAVLEHASNALSNGNLEHSLNTTQTSYSTIKDSISTGNFYYEFTVGPAAAYNSFGLSNTNSGRSSETNPSSNIWWWSNEQGTFRSNNCAISNDTMSKVQTGDIVGVSFNDGEGKGYVNGVHKFDFSNINDIAGNDEVYVAFDRASNDGVGNIVNFGQQPFAAPNVTHDWDAGTVEIDGETYNTLYNVLAPQTATLTIADAGTLGLVEGTPNVTAKVGGATGRYVSHTDTTLELANVSGTWSTASETAISDQEQSIAAINPDDFVMSSTDFSATPLETTHKSSTWQVTAEADSTFASPVIDVTSESALTSYNAGGLEGDTIYRARVKHTSTNNVDSDWSDTISQNVFKTEPVSLEIPDADMHGLRFDSARSTGLSRTFNSDVSAEFTYSFWVKPTKENSYASYFYNGLESTDQFSLAYMNATNKIHVISGNTPQPSNTTLDVNVWQHIVIKRDGSNTIYISKNGGPWDSSVVCAKCSN